jgi:hypothetical protein
VPTLRLLSVDARAVGRDGVRLAKSIADADPDVVCIHNGPRLGRWRAAVARIARGSGRVVVCAGGLNSGANVLMSTLAVDSLATREVRLTGESRLKVPGAALAAMRTRGTEFVLGSVTLIGNAAERLAQARELQTAIDAIVPVALPAVISALGSDRPGTAAWQSLADSRVAVVGRLFVDERLEVAEDHTIFGGPDAPPAVLAVLRL